MTSRRFDFIREDWIKWGKGTVLALAMALIPVAIRVLEGRIDSGSFWGPIELALLIQAGFWFKNWIAVKNYSAPLGPNPTYFSPTDPTAPTTPVV